MGKRLKVLSLLLVLLTPVWAVANTIVVVGDSISAAYGMALEDGWVNLLEKRLDEHYPDQYEVVNASISGDTTAGGLKRLPKLLDTHTPSKVIIELGGNDGLRGMSVKAMSENLQQMIDMSRQKGAEVILMTVPLPPSYGWFFNQRFQKVFDDLADENDIARVALKLDMVDGDGMIQADGIHPTEKAQPIMVNEVWETLIKD